MSSSLFQVRFARKLTDFPSAAHSPFDKLPDEIVSLVLECLFENEDSLYGQRANASTLSRRFERLVEDSFRVWDLDKHTLPYLFLQRRLHRTIKIAYYLISDTGGLVAFKYMSLLLPSFSSLTPLNLSCDFFSEGDTRHFPLTFTRALRSLKHLSKLDISLEVCWTFEDPSFRVADLPNLAKLVLSGVVEVHRFLTIVPDSLIAVQLSIISDDDNGDDAEKEAEDVDDTFELLPWARLSSLGLYFSTGKRSHQRCKGSGRR